MDFIVAAEGADGGWGAQDPFGFRILAARDFSFPLITLASSVRTWSHAPRFPLVGR
jgi:hypothetical protein